MSKLTDIHNIKKDFPTDFSKDLTDVVKLLTMPSSKKVKTDIPQVFGSASFKVNYPSDYDFFQKLTIDNNKIKLLPEFKKIIKKLLSYPYIYIGDIKCGEIEEWRIIPLKTNELNYNERLPQMINKVEELKNNKIISKKESDEFIDLLKPSLKALDLAMIKDKIRIEILRWKPIDILNGFVIYRNMKFMFNDMLFNTNALMKIDVIGWVEGIRYTEITMVYMILAKEKFLTASFDNIINEIRDAIPNLLNQGKYMKIAKRISTLERLRPKPNQKMLKVIFNLVNSDLGVLNQIVSDLTNIEFLVENKYQIPKEKYLFEIDQLKNRLSNITNELYQKYELEVIDLIDKNETSKIQLKKIDELKKKISLILNTETKKYLIEHKILPIDKYFLPNIYGTGIWKTIIKGINYISNKFPASDEYATNIEEGEEHGVLLLPNGKFGRANYMGPGTEVLKRLKRGDVPRTAMDELSRAHDIRYNLSTSQKDIEKADEIFIKGAEKIQKEKLDNLFNIYVAKIPIQTKLYAERKGIIKPMFKKLEDSIKDFTNDEMNLMKDTLKTAEKKGYGKKK